MLIDIDECALGTDQCAQNCHNNVGYYTCSCNAGYTLNSDGYHCDGNNHFLKCSGVSNVLTCFTDTDECAIGTDHCFQNCNNTVGSYTCSCWTGYTLNADGRHCDGITECDMTNIVSVLFM